MRRPAIPFALALASAIAAGRAEGPTPCLVAAIAIAATALVLAFFPRCAAFSTLGTVLALGLTAGAVLEWRHYRFVGTGDIRAFLSGGAAAPEPGGECESPGVAPESTILTGRVADEPIFRAVDFLRYTGLRLEAESLERGGRAARVSGTVLVYVWQEAPLAVGYGDGVRIRGSLAAPRGPTNPGEADRRASLADERIYAIFSVPKEAPVEVIARGGGSIMGAVFALRARLRRDLLATVSGEAGAFLDSIILGTRTVLREEVIQDFQRTGTIHMLVVSGLHTSLLAAFLWLLFTRALRLPAPLAIVGTLALAVVYCLITGAQPSILRATIMIAIVLVGKLLRRESDTLNSLALAGIAILGMSPGHLMNAGFELSFVAIVGLELIARPLQRAYAAALPEVGARAGVGRRAAILGARWMGGMACASLAAFIATEPLVAWRFHLVTPGIVVANLAAVLLCSAVLYSGFALLFVAPISKAAAAPVAWLAGHAATAFLALVHWLAHVPGVYLYVADLPGSRVAASYAAIGALAFLLSKVAAARFSRRARGAAGVLALLGAGAFLVPPGPRPIGGEAARLAVLDVGTGNTAVLRTDRAVVLFDCGGGRIETGVRVTAPYLWSEGVRRIDAVFLSHAHADHIDGLLDVADRFPIGRVFVGPWFADAEGGRRLLAGLEARRIPVEVVEARRSIDPARGVRVEVLGPCAKELVPEPLPHEPRYEGQNNTSLVLRARVAGRRVLFPGDIETDATALLVRSGADIDCDVALVPHHGGPNRCIEDLVELAGPRVAISSAKWGFAVPRTLAAFERAGASVLETSAGGAVLVDLSAARVEARIFLRDWRRNPLPPAYHRRRGAPRAPPPGLPTLAVRTIERTGEDPHPKRGRRTRPPREPEGPDAFPPCGEPRIVTHPPLPSAPPEPRHAPRRRPPRPGSRP